ncbi:peptide cleavage/export ABC transporter [Streptococcus agalactiae]|uniref:peptide cleavage/export ABC transporter n=2 Tax=Streptococcus agalactiae TaxID=1311 RepID=UPI000C0D32D1|nr:peptide cleavage/export ABC transporter [Streptococcus agalactiae]MCC9878893.1 peptide cleavage/export ABC transporter [Streptococcus agalactiae]PHU33486.1 ABC transporter ATP-binding protein [Streptococcus agalactiae]SUN18971.1 competence factor transporting ATP-binding protein/permease ComA [Streptococcus agalactiae]
MKFTKKHYRSQVDSRDCGVAVIAMILEYYGSHYSLSTLRELTKTSDEGTTALAIVKTLSELHFEVSSIKANINLFRNSELPFPFIVHVIKKESNLLHYYVVIDQEKDFIYIADPDPSVKIRKISCEVFENEWTGIAIIPTPNSEYTPHLEKKNNLFNLLPILLKHVRLILTIVLLTLLVTAINIVGSYYLQSIIDNYIPNKMVNTLSIISLGLVVAYAFQQILSYGQEFLLLRLEQRLTIDVILAYIKHIFKLPMSFFFTRQTGDLISRFTDANSIVDALASTILSVFLDISTVIIVSIFLLLQNKNLFLISLSAIPIYIIIIFSFIKKFEVLNRQRMEANAVMSSSIIEDIKAIESIKSLTSEKNRYKKVENEFLDYLEKSFKYSQTESIQRALKKLFQLILNVTILWIGSKLVIHKQISLGQLITYNMLLVYFTTPLENIINLQVKLQTASVANNRLNEVYLVNSEFSNKNNISLPDPFKEIVFKEISYRYGYGNYVLSNINLKINQGKKVAFVGASGSGKSTLAKLLVNFFEPTNGNITLNNISIDTINKQELRQFINYLPQQPYIFSGTILENLVLGSRENITEKEILKAVEIAEIRYDIEKLPLKYNTQLSSENLNLSGGQLQRIALARALLANPSVLILDESTSNLDVLTEKNIINNLISLDITIIFIAHRLTIAEKVDEIFVFEKGQIIEKGDHDYLLQKNGFYRHLFFN